MEFDVVPGVDKPKHPQSIVLVDALTGLAISADNPLAVTLGAGGLQLTGAVNIGTSMEISNDVGNPIPVIGPLTDGQLRNTPVAVSGSVTAVGPLTNSQLRSSAVSVSGPATNAELRATALEVTGTVAISGTTPVSGPATISEIRQAPITVTGTVAAVGPLTNTELRNSALPVSMTSVPTHGVTGTFWQPVQPVSLASVPLASGAASLAKQPALGVAGTPAADVITVQGAALMTPFKVDGSAVTQPVTGPLTDYQLRNAPVEVTGTVATTGTYWQATQPVSQASQPLPLGAATSIKQPNFGTVGFASPDVLTVQGAPSMNALKVDGSAVTQPISGVVTVSNIVTVSGPLTETQLRNSPIAVSGTVTATGPLTNSELRSSAIAVSGPATNAELRLTPLPVTGSMTVSGPLTDTQLRNSAVAISGTVTATGPLTDTQLRNAAVAVTGPVTNTQLRASPIEVTGGLTDGQLRATPINVAGPATNTELRATPLPVSGTVTSVGPLTNSELRFAPVSVIGPLTETQLRTVTLSVDGPVTDAQMRANPIPVSGSFTVTGSLTDEQLRASPIPVAGSFTVTGALTDTELRNSPVPVSIASVPTHGVTGTFWQPTQPVSGPITNTQLRASPIDVAGSVTAVGPLTFTELRSAPVAVSGPATIQEIRQNPIDVAGTVAVSGTIPVSGPATDAQLRLSPLAVTGTVAVTGSLTDAQLRNSAVAVSVASIPVHGVTGTFWQATQPVSVASVPLAPLAATSTKQPSLGTAGTPSTDVLTVQGAALMTPFKVDGSAVTQPVSGPLTDGQLRNSAIAVTGTVATTGTYWQATQPVSVATLPLAALAATSTKQPAFSTAGSPSTEVLTVQGAATMTPFKVDGSGFTQPVSGTVSVAGTLPVSGPLTDTQLRNSALNVAGTVGISGTVPVSGPLTDGQLRLAPVPVSGTVSTIGTYWQATQPVSLASLPIPTGAALASKQPAIGSPGTPSSDVLTVQGSAAMVALKTDGSGVIQPVSGTVSVAGTIPVSISSMPTTPVSGTFWPTTQPISVVSLPIPTGAALANKQPALGAPGTASTDVLTVQGAAGMTPLKVDGSSFTQPVSGTVAVSGSVATTGTYWQAVQPISVSTLPLPTGAASLAKQPQPGTAGVASSDVITVQGIASMTPFKVDGSAVTQPVSGSVAISGSVATTGTYWQATQPISAVALPLPSGAASLAKQPALGVAGTPSADVLTVQGAATMTPFKVDGSAVTQPVSIASVPTHGVTGTFWQATQPVSGTVSISGSVATTGTYWQATQPISAVALPLAPLAATSTKQPALGTAGVASPDIITVQGVAGMTAMKVDGSAVTQPVSGTVAVSGSVAATGTFWQTTQPVSVAALPLPSLAATSAKQPNFGVSGTPSVDVLTVQGATFMTPFKVDGSATTQPVTGTFWQATQPISAAALPLAPLAATSTKQPALGTAGTPSADVLTVQGAATMTPFKVDGSAVTQPVSLASVPTHGVTGTFWQATQPISAISLPLPSGAASLAKQPALGTAGVASPDIITVQGVAGMTAMKVDGSAVIQPVSGPATDTQLRAAPLPTFFAVADTVGTTFNPDSCSHTYAYTNGLLVTDTATNGVNTWIKTYTYSGYDLTGESRWVKQ